MHLSSPPPTTTCHVYLLVLTSLLQRSRLVDHPRSVSPQRAAQPELLLLQGSLGLSQVWPFWLNCTLIKPPEYRYRRDFLLPALRHLLCSGSLGPSCSAGHGEEEPGTRAGRPRWDPMRAVRKGSGRTGISCCLIRCHGVAPSAAAGSSEPAPPQASRADMGTKHFGL